MCTFSASWLFLVIGHPATGHLCRWRDDLAGPCALKSSTLAVGALTTATAAGSSSTGWFWSWAKFSKTEKHSNILHIYESWHVHDSCHIVFGLSKPCQDILINHHQGGSPCPAPSEWVEVKKPGMEEPVGEMEERGKPVFREGGVPTLCLAIWCSDEKSYTGGWQMDGM